MDVADGPGAETFAGQLTLTVAPAAGLKLAVHLLDALRGQRRERHSADVRLDMEPDVLL
jgi:hypothetical protein